MLPYLIAGAIGFGIGKLFENGGETFMAGGMTNEDILRSFLTSERETQTNNLATFYSTLGGVMLLRNYGTLIAKRMGRNVEITNVKHSKTTSAITNRLKALAEEMGYNVSYVSEFENVGETFMAGGTTNEDIIFEYPKDSNGRIMRWINVGKGNDEIASKTGTIGQVRAGHQLIVLQSETPNKVDYHILVDYLPEENKINMVRGKANSEPSPKYQSYINDLFRMLRISQKTRDYQDEDIANQVYVKKYLIHNFGNPPKGCEIKAKDLGVEIHYDSTNQMANNWAMKIADKYGYPSGNFEMRYSSGNVPIFFIDRSKIAGNTTKSGKGFINFGETFMAGGRMTKYVQLYFVQGNYGQGWEDLTAHDNRKDAIAEMRVYDDNESYPHRVIQRRVLRTDYEKGNYADGGEVELKTWRENGVSENEKMDNNKLTRSEVKGILKELGYNVTEDNFSKFHKKEHFDYIKEKDIFYRNDVNDNFADGGDISRLNDNYILEVYFGNSEPFYLSSPELGLNSDDAFSKLRDNAVVVSMKDAEDFKKDILSNDEFYSPTVKIVSVYAKGGGVGGKRFNGPKIEKRIKNLAKKGWVIKKIRSNEDGSWYYKIQKPEDSNSDRGTGIGYASFFTYGEKNPYTDYFYYNTHGDNDERPNNVWNYKGEQRGPSGGWYSFDETYIENLLKEKGKISFETKMETGGEVGKYTGGGGLPKKRRRSASVQYGTSDRAFDKQLTAKPVGYRFTNAKANQLRKDPYDKPTKAEVKEYRGKGIYKENRKNRSDRDRNVKL